MAEDDLILNKEGVPEELSAQDDTVWDETMPHQYVDTAINTLYGLDGIDIAILSKEDQKRIKQMRRWCIRIAHFYLKDIFTDLVSEDEPDEND